MIAQRVFYIQPIVKITPGLQICKLTSVKNHKLVKSFMCVVFFHSIFVFSYRSTKFELFWYKGVIVLETRGRRTGSQMALQHYWHLVDERIDALYADLKKKLCKHHQTQGGKFQTPRGELSRGTPLYSAELNVCCSICSVQLSWVYRELNSAECTLNWMCATPEWTQDWIQMSWKYMQ